MFTTLVLCFAKHYSHILWLYNIYIWRKNTLCFCCNILIIINRCLYFKLNAFTKQQLFVNEIFILIRCLVLFVWKIHQDVFRVSLG
jgi:hypothetical protein